MMKMTKEMQERLDSIRSTRYPLLGSTRPVNVVFLAISRNTYIFSQGLSFSKFDFLLVNCYAFAFAA